MFVNKWLNVYGFRKMVFLLNNDLGRVDFLFAHRSIVCLASKDRANLDYRYLQS